MIGHNRRNAQTISGMIEYQGEMTRAWVCFVGADVLTEQHATAISAVIFVLGFFFLICAVGSSRK